MNKELFDRSFGCLLGGACGDAKGAIAEMMTIEKIRKQFGMSGVTAYLPHYGKAGLWTDDTQMTVATAEGLAYATSEQEIDILGAIWLAYQMWGDSQQYDVNRRGPGRTCIGALTEGLAMGTLGHPINDSKGCGAVMRVHPVGIFFHEDPEKAFQYGMSTGAMTHGNPDAYVSAGFMAAMIANLVSGAGFARAVTDANLLMTKLVLPMHREGTFKMVDLAMTLPYSPKQFAENVDAIFHTDGVKHPGGGWLGHEALGIAIYAVRHAASDPIEVMRLAINHSGDSDTTGCLAGAIMGALHGATPFEQDLQKYNVEIEGKSLLHDLAQRLIANRTS